MILVSIVIPVYNVEQYLRCCVDSVVRTCSGIEHEILLVDDGSTDSSGAICDDLALSLPNMVVIHKPNGGLSDARNCGTAKARGKYVFYLDSDDYLATDGIGYLLTEAMSSDCDVVCGNFYYQYPDHAVLFDKNQYGSLRFDGGEEALRELMAGKHFQNFAWGKLIKRELAQRFPFPKGKLFEDIFWFHLVLHEANSILVIDKPVVHYVQRSGSISFAYSVRSLDILDGYVERLRFLEEHYPAIVDAQKALMANICVGQAWTISRCLKSDEKKEALAKLRATIAECCLQDCALLDKRQRRDINAIMRSLLHFKCVKIMDKISAYCCVGK